VDEKILKAFFKLYQVKQNIAQDRYTINW